ncbi:MAG: hypothetical protein ACYSOF_08500 [Planctomycetota bacterium]|jgi:hypothetical protein
MKVKLFLCSAVCLLGTVVFSDEVLDVYDLLDRHAKTQGKIRHSYINKHETTVKWKGYNKQRPSIGKGHLYEQHNNVELRSDGNRYYSSLKIWGDTPGGSPTTQQQAGITRSLWDGQFRYQYMLNPDSTERNRIKNGQLYIKPQSECKVPPRRICDSADGGVLRGFFYGSNERIDEEIKQAETISLEPETETVNGSQCYVIHANTKRCKYKIWIDPEHDYHIARAVVHRQWGSASRPETRSTPPPEGTSQSTMENVVFKKIDDIWVPVECDCTLNIKYVDGAYNKSQSHHRVTDYVINPDHDTLGSFETDFIRNGARVKIIGEGGVTYTWQDGKLLDSHGKVVFESSDEKAPLQKKIN